MRLLLLVAASLAGLLALPSSSPAAADPFGREPGSPGGPGLLADSLDHWFCTPAITESNRTHCVAAMAHLDDATVKERQMTTRVSRKALAVFGLVLSFVLVACGGEATATVTGRFEGIRVGESTTMRARDLVEVANEDRLPFADNVLTTTNAEILVRVDDAAGVSAGRVVAVPIPLATRPPGLLGPTPDEMVATLRSVAPVGRGSRSSPGPRGCPACRRTGGASATRPR